MEIFDFSENFVTREEGKIGERAGKMETQRIIEFPHKNMDKRPRKRQRLTWDMPPPVPPPKVLILALSCKYGFRNFYFVFSDLVVLRMWLS